MAMVLEKRGPGIQRLTLVVGMALVLAACGGATVDKESATEDLPVDEGLVPTTLDLSGIWLQVEDPSRLGLLLRFSLDHTFAIDDRGELDTTPAALGTYELDEDAITFTSEGSDLCTEGDSWAWQVTLPEDGRLHIVHTEEAADRCRTPLGSEWTFIRMSPSSAAIRAITATGPAEGRPPKESELAGIWLPVGPTGLLVRFGPDGRFAIDNKGHLAPDPAVPGTYKVDGDRITFTSGGSACPGDSFAWRASLAEDGLLRIVHIEEGSGNCRVPRGTEWTLIRVSPRSAASAEITAEGTAG